MVKPLSQRKRLTLLILAVIVFFLFLPIVILYSSGYRLGENWEVVQTGAIQIGTQIRGASITIDGKEIGESGYFKNSFFVQNLTPKKYEISVSKTGYSVWTKNLMVKEQMISRVEALVLPIKPKITEIQKFLPLQTLESNTDTGAKSVATGTANTLGTTSNAIKIVNREPVISPEYLLASSSFATTTSVNSEAPATSSMRLYRVKSDIALWHSDSSVFVNWLGNESSIPEFMSDDINYFKKSIVVHSDSVKNIDFLPGREDVLIYSDKDGVKVIEIDKRSPQNSVKISEADSDFRLGTNGEIYILKSDKYYLLNLD